MILDTINRVANYFYLSDDLKTALKILQNFDSNSEKCDILFNDRIRIIVDEYETTLINKNQFEMHANTIDIQYPLLGQEMVQWHNSIDVKEISAYSYEYDRTYFSVNSKPIDLQIGCGQFAIFFAGELHNPGLAVTSSSIIKKLTIKIKA